MNSIVYKTCKFNELGMTPQGFSPENMETAYGIFAEEVEEVRAAISIVDDISKSHTRAATHTSGVATEILDGCVDSVITAIGILYRMGLEAGQIDEAFEIVGDANLSKFPQTEKEALQSVIAYKDDARYFNVDYKAVGDGFVVFGAKSDGSADYKILKSVNTIKPEQQLRSLVSSVYVQRDKL